MAVDEATEAKATAPASAVSSAKAFATKHGGSARAVVENIGRIGARIVLVGEDGAFGDVVVADVPTAEAVVGAVDELTASEWDSETTGALKIGAAHRRKMAGPRAR